MTFGGMADNWPRVLILIKDGAAETSTHGALSGQE